jgi:hypothetical protein
VNGERERRKEVLKDVVLLFGRAVSRSRDSGFDDQLEESIRGALKTAKQELTHLRNQTGSGGLPDLSLRGASKTLCDGAIRARE